MQSAVIRHAAADPYIGVKRLFLEYIKFVQSYRIRKLSKGIPKFTTKKVRRIPPKGVPEQRFRTSGRGGEGPAGGGNFFLYTHCKQGIRGFLEPNFGSSP